MRTTHHRFLDMHIEAAKAHSISETEFVGIARGLVVSCNPKVQAMAAEALRGQAISCEHASSAEACEQKLRCQRFEIIFLDSELPEQGLKYLQTLRSKPRFSRVVLVAVTHTNKETSQAYAYGAQFCAQGEGPALRLTLDRVIRAAYGFILRERRRYFRCPLDVDVMVERRDEPGWNAKSVNISEGGICFIAGAHLTQGEQVKAMLRLPSTNVLLNAHCQVQWSDIAFRTGAQFLQMDQKTTQELHEWLATQFELSLSATIASSNIARPRT